MKVIVMGCGRVGSELALQLLEGDHEVAVIDKKPEAFIKYPPGTGAKTIVGLGFDRDVLEEAGIKEADAFVAVSSGDNSNIVSARVALEHYHVPKVVARIYDPRRAEIYERLNIPTVATTKWGVKQIQLMLFHDRQRAPREPRGRRPGARARPGAAAPGREDGRRRSTWPGKSWSPRVSRGGGGFIPTDAIDAAGGRLPRRDHGEGRHGPAGRGARAAVGRRAALMRVVVTGAGAVGRHLAADLADRGHDVTLIDQSLDVVEKAQEWAPNVNVVLGDACEPWVLERAEL